MYVGFMPGMKSGDVVGHEFMGIIEDVGREVKSFKKGDRVVASGLIACFKCWACNEKSFSLCESTNPSKEMDTLYGDRTAGLYGYSHLTGGFPRWSSRICSGAVGGQQLPQGARGTYR